MARLYANENIPVMVVDELRRLGHDVLTTFESGRAGLAIPDDEVLEFSTNENRILITINRKHFIRLHRINSGHTGIIVCTFDLDYIGLARRIHKSIEDQQGMAHQLIRVNRPG